MSGTFGHFEGEVVARWLKDAGPDRSMKLDQDFVYVDPDGKRWRAPRGSVVNGASIPALVWEEVGSPFVGDYRRASVIHDVACHPRYRRLADSEAVHRMFYHAMRCDGVGFGRATLMYRAVKHFGPRWSVATGGSLRFEDESLSMERLRRVVSSATAELDEDVPIDGLDRRIDALLYHEPHSPNKGPGPMPKKKRAQVETSKMRSQTGKSNPGSTKHQPSERAAAAVKAELATTTDLPTFRQTPTSLSREDRILLASQALVLIEQNYVHLPLKEAMHAVDPVQRLRLLLYRLRGTPDDLLPSDLEFHREMSSIFHSVRDLHTNYILPVPFKHMTAYVPFLIEDYVEGAQRKYLVAHLMEGFVEQDFEPGVEVLRWNGIPIDRAVELNGDRFAGSNPEARRARGLETLTIRSLALSLPPDEERVIVDYRTADGREHEVRTDWLVFRPDTGGIAGVADVPQDVAIAQGLDLELELVRRAKKVLFAPQVAELEYTIAGEGRTQTRGQIGDLLPTSMPQIFGAKVVETDPTEFAYVRIRSFNVNDPRPFLDEFLRLIRQLPQNGLILDVRGNGGGLITAGEQLLQLLTPRTVEPALFQFVNTPLNLAICERHPFLAEWVESIRESVSTGARYSRGFPITSPEDANAVGQEYRGPVVLITDALCYSTTDIFAAGFQDHAIGVILGVDENTGAGGANVWDHGLLKYFYPSGVSGSPYEPLPHSAGMRVSIRRTIRVGPNAGTPIEDLGIRPDALHHMTRRDLLEGNVDLIETATTLLADMPQRRLDVEIVGQSDGTVEIDVTTCGLDCVDIYGDDRPLGSVDVADGVTPLEIPAGASQVLEFLGYAAGDLVASRKIVL